jgi:hypothetical protein
LFGLPCYLWLKRVRRDSYSVAAAIGFFVAPISISYWTWPLQFGSGVGQSYVQGVLVEKDGVPTLAGWLNYAQFILPIALTGMVAALVFYSILRRTR